MFKERLEQINCLLVLS